jgi:hypothetical protein
MSKPRRKKIAYFILVLLILLVVAIIGGLSAVLFNMQVKMPERPDSTGGELSEVRTNAVSRVTPTAEMYIEIPPENTPNPKAEDPATGSGIIPTVCDGYGTQIQGRGAYRGPTTHQVEVSPNRVRFTINVPNRQPTEGPSNIR